MRGAPPAAWPERRCKPHPCGAGNFFKNNHQTIEIALFVIARQGIFAPAGRRISPAIAGNCREYAMGVLWR